MNTIRILLVDDEEVITFGFSKVLAGPGIIIDCAQTADEAKILTDKYSYTAAMIDLGLSNSNILEGIDVVRLLKQSQPDCVLVVITAYGEDDTRKHTMEAGADIFLEKPVEPQKFKEVLRELGVL